MSDGPPTQERAISTFLDYLALACIFGFVDALIAGKWLTSLGALAAALVFHIAGIKWPQIKELAGTRFDSVLWDTRIALAIQVLRVLLILAGITIILTGYHELRRLHRPVDHIQIPSVEQAPKSPNAILRVDWHDKQNWRRYLHTGMTRAEVRQLFGEPEKMSVVLSSEFWRYGDGQIDFDMDGHPDGSLYLWSEP